MSKNLVLVNFSVDNSIMRELLESKMSHFFKFSITIESKLVIQSYETFRCEWFAC